MIGKLIRFFVLILLAPLLYAFTYDAFLFFRSSITFEAIQWFALGFVLYLLIYAIFLQGRINFLEGLYHEMAHALASLMLLQMPERMVVESSGAGQVKTTSGCFLTALAPYYFPLLTIPFLLLKPFMPAPIDIIMDSLIGFTLAFHYTMLIRQFHLKQTDITDTGVIFSVVITFFLNLVFLVIIIAVVVENYAGILDYFENSFDRTIETYKAAIKFLRTKVLPAIQDFLQR